MSKSPRKTAMKQKAIAPEDALLKASARYLESKGWRVVVVGVDRIQQGAGERKYIYELIIRFVGNKMLEVEAK